jgi:hypothetical protein
MGTEQDENIRDKLLLKIKTCCYIRLSSLLIRAHYWLGMEVDVEAAGISLPLLCLRSVRWLNLVKAAGKCKYLLNGKPNLL